MNINETARENSTYWMY